MRRRRARAAAFAVLLGAWGVVGCGDDDRVDEAQARPIRLAAAAFIRALVDGDVEALAMTIETSCRPLAGIMTDAASALSASARRVQIASVDVTWIRGDTAEAVIRATGDVVTGGPAGASLPSSLRFVVDDGAWVVDCDHL